MKIDKYFHLYSWDDDVVFEEIEKPELKKKGKWIEKHHAYSDEGEVIEEWQTCKCSACGRYETKPYLYYFSESNYCSWCGADMQRGEGE